MKIIVIGGNSGSKIVTEMLQGYDIYYIETYWDEMKKYQLSDNYKNAVKYINEGYNYFIATGDNKIRSEIYKYIKSNTSKEPINCIHPSSVISKSAVIGYGNLICPNSTIYTNAYIGNCTIINTSSVIEHDCIMEDFSQVSPNTTLCGNVRVGRYSFISAGATVIPNIQIGENVIVAAGGVVLNNVPNNVMVAGVPTKIKKEL